MEELGVVVETGMAVLVVSVLVVLIRDEVSEIKLWWKKEKRWRVK